jgi:hypothetical protein
MTIDLTIRAGELKRLLAEHGLQVNIAATCPRNLDGSPELALARALYDAGLVLEAIAAPASIEQAAVDLRAVINAFATLLEDDPPKSIHKYAIEAAKVLLPRVEEALKGVQPYNGLMTDGRFYHHGKHVGFVKLELGGWRARTAQWSSLGVFQRRDDAVDAVLRQGSER